MSVESRLWRRRRAAAAALVLGMLCAAGATQACEARLVKAPETVRVDYNPFAAGTAVARLDLELANPGEACPLEVVVTDLAGAPLAWVTLSGVDLELRARAGAMLVRNEVHPELFTFELPAGRAARLEFDVAVLRDAVPQAGEHGQEILLTVRTPAGEPVIPPIQLKLVLASAPRAQVNIAGAAGAFGSSSSVEVIDFGLAATGTVKRAFLQIRANAESVVTFASEHHGEMWHADLGDKAPPFPYEVRLDGEVLDLSGAATTRTVDPPRTIAGVSLPMDFTLGALNGQMSGVYTDLITIDISAQ